MAEREGHDPLLEVGADLVRHPRPPALSDPERLKPPAVDPALEPVVARAVDAHCPASGGDVAELLGQGEQAQAESDEHVMLCHRALLSIRLVAVTLSLSERADAPAAAGASHFKASLSTCGCRRNLGLVRARASRV